jgi:hypothetical protein
MTAESKGRLLQTRGEIMKEYGLTETTFQMFLKAGMPVVVIQRRYYAHTDNLDRFFQTLTNGRVAKFDEAVE